MVQEIEEKGAVVIESGLRMKEESERRDIKGGAI